MSPVKKSVSVTSLQCAHLLSIFISIIPVDEVKFLKSELYMHQKSLCRAYAWIQQEPLRL